MAQEPGTAVPVSPKLLDQQLDIIRDGVTDGQKMDSNSSEPHFSRSRIIWFLGVFSTTLLAATWFVCATWNHFWRTASMPVWQIIFPAMTLLFVATTILGRRYSNLWLRLGYRISAIWLGVLNYSFFAAGAAWVFSAAAALLSFHIEPELIAATFLGGAMVTSICGLVNAYWLRVTRVTVKLANLPANWRGGTVALVADLHLGNARGARFARRVVAKIQQLQPDAVLISGDLFDGSKADLDALLKPWKGLSAPAGAYFVTGNHEEFTDRAQYLDAVERAGIRVLNNEKVEINGLQLVGVHDAELHDPPLFRAALQGAKLDRNRPSILLAHQPLNLSDCRGGRRVLATVRPYPRRATLAMDTILRCRSLNCASTAEVIMPDAPSGSFSRSSSPFGLWKVMTK